MYKIKSKISHNSTTKAKEMSDQKNPHLKKWRSAFESITARYSRGNINAQFGRIIFEEDFKSLKAMGDKVDLKAMLTELKKLREK